MVCCSISVWVEWATEYINGRGDRGVVCSCISEWVEWATENINGRDGTGEVCSNSLVCIIILVFSSVIVLHMHL